MFSFELIMMVQVIYLISHGAVTLITLFSLAVRLEHRLTKIETDVSWLKDRYVGDKDD